MEQGKALQRSLVVTIAAFLVFHSAFGILVSALFRIRPGALLAFLAACALYHVFLFVLLNLFRGSFFLEASGEALRRINLPIFLSMIRLTAVPTVMFLLLSIGKVPVLAVVVPILVMIFLTDLFDGMMARRLHQQTRIGRYMDATSDYTNLILISVVYFVYGLIPAWFFILILLRLIIHGTGILVLYARGGHGYLKGTLLGKASVFATMVLYSFELMELMRVPVLGHPRLLLLMEYTAALIIAVSLIQKILFLWEAFTTLRDKPD